MAVSYFPTTADNTPGTAGVSGNYYKEVTLTAAVGDRLFVWGASADANTTGAGDVQTSAGPGALDVTGWVMMAESHVANSTGFTSAYGTVGTAGSITVRIDVQTSISTALMAGGVWLVPSGEWTGTPTIVAITGTPATGLVSLTVPSTSNVFYAMGDWNAATVGTTTSPAGGTVDERYLGSGTYSLFAAHWGSQAAGTTSYGSSGGSGQLPYGVVLAQPTSSTTTSVAITRDVSWNTLSNQVQYVGAGTFTSGTAALTVPLPAAATTGDLLLLAVESANQAVTTPTGWTSLNSIGTGTAAAAGGVMASLFWRWYAAGSVSVADSGDHTTARIVAFRNVDPNTPFNGAAATRVDSTGTTTLTTPSVTVPSNGIAFHMVALDRDAATTDTEVNAVTGATLIGSNTVTSGAGGGLGLLYSTAGQLTQTGGFDTSLGHAYVSVAIDSAIQPVSVSRSTSWNVAAPVTGTPVSTTRTVSWNTAAQVSTSRTLSWNTRAFVSTTRVLSWNVLTSVTPTRTLSWVTNFMVPITRSMTWNVLGQVPVSRVLSWNVSGPVLVTRSISWNTASNNVTSTVYGTAVPGGSEAADANAYAFGTVIQCVVAGNVTAIRFYQTPSMATQTVTVRLYVDSNTTEVRSATYSLTGGTAQWVEVPITPYAVTAGQYVMAAYTTTGYYQAQNSGLIGGHTSSDGKLIAPESPTFNGTGSNARYTTTVTAIPDQTFQSTAYFADLVLTTSGTSSVSISRTPSWNVNSSISTTRAASWNTLTPVATTRALLWNTAGSTTSVSISRSTSWNVAAQVSTSRMLSWTTNGSGWSSTVYGTGAPTGATQTTDSGSYNLGTVIECNVAGSITSLRFYVTSPRASFSSTLRLYVDGNTTAVREVTVTTPDFTSASGWVEAAITPYAVTAGQYVMSAYTIPGGLYSSQVNGILSPIPNADGRLTIPSSVTFNGVSGNGRYTTTLTAIPDSTYSATNYYSDVTLSGAGTSSVSISRTASWNTATQTSALRSASWNVRTPATISRSASWNVAATATSVSISRALLWNTQSTLTSAYPGVAYPGLTYPGYSTSISVTVSRAASWNTLSKTTAPRVVSWNVRSTTSISRTVSWNTLQGIQTSRIVLWSVIGRVGPTRTLLWNVLTPSPIVSRSVSYNVRAYSSMSRQILYSVLTKTAQVTRDIHWNDYNSCVITRVLSWNDRAPVTVTRVVLWNTLGNLAYSMEYIWDGSAWQPLINSYWDGNAWQTTNRVYWNGTAWVS